MNSTRTPYFIQSILLLMAIGLTSCSGVRPAGGLGMVLKGDANAAPPPTTRDVIEMPALQQDQARTLFKTSF